MGERESVPLHWLEEQISNTLYHEELELGAGTLDIGLWGPALFGKEADCILAEIRPEFAYFIRGNGEKLEAIGSIEVEPEI